MANTGVLTATSVLEVGDGPTYTNASNAEASDGIFATASILSSSNAEGLALYGYPGSVPDTATIMGVEVTVTAKSSVAGTMSAEVTLIYQFAGYSSSKISSTFTTSNATYTLGSPTDLWDTTTPPFTPLTPEVVNDPTFGVLIYAETGTAATVSIDSGQINIYYTVPGGVSNSLMMMQAGI